MNNNSSFFYILCRLKKIFRWNGTNVVETDNVMEHSYRVMVISYLLYVIRRKEKLVNPDLGILLVNAMMHDATDAILTHIPTNVRDYSDCLKNGYNEAKKKSLHYIKSMYPKDYLFKEMTEDDLIKYIIDEADLLDGYCKAQREVNLGNKEFECILKLYNDKLENVKKSSVEIEIFLDKFVAEIDLDARYRYLEEKQS